MKDLDFGRGGILAMEKGHKDRVTPLHEQLLNAGRFG